MEILDWQILHPRGAELLGFIPTFILESDPRSAAEQFNERYAHGGGWRPFGPWSMDKDYRIKYPGDPAYAPVAMARLRNETIFVYPHAWVAIVQADGSFEVARMD